MLTIITLSNLVSYVIMILTIVRVGTYFTSYKRNFHQLLLINSVSFLLLQVTLLDIIQNVYYNMYTLYHVRQFQTVGVYLYVLILHLIGMFILQNCKILTYPTKERQTSNNSTMNNCSQTTSIINQKWVTMLLVIVLSSTTYLLSFETYSVYKNVLFTDIYTLDSIQKSITILSYTTIIIILTIVFYIIRKNFLYSTTIVMYVIYIILTYKLYNTGQSQYAILYSVSNVMVHLLYLLSVINVIKQLHRFFATIE